jgi:DNA-directed RNA polymerase subunit E'/Rpb7
MLKLSKNIPLNPIHLDHNLKNHLFNKIEQDYKGYCFKEYGYVKEIVKITSFLNNAISNTDGTIIFHVDFIIDVIKPNNGEVVEGVIFHINERGVFITLHENGRIFVPVVNMGSYKYESNNTYKDGDDVYNVDDKIQVIIIDMRYDKNKFDYIGKL